MFGAQSPEIQQALSSENIANLEKMGVMNITLRHQPEKGEFRLVNYYEISK